MQVRLSWVRLVSSLAACVLASGTGMSAQTQQLTLSGVAPCSATFDSLRSVFEHDYAAYPITAKALGAKLKATTRRTQQVVASAPDWLTCVNAIHRWTPLFRDSHLAFYYVGPPKPPRVTAATNSPDPVPVDTMDQPRIRYPDDSTAILTLPHFEWKWKTAVDSLVASNSTRLQRAPYWVVDVRNNQGGCTCTFESLTPFLYAAPIHLVGADARSSEGNIAWYRGWLADSTFPDEDKPQVREVIARMETHPGRFVVWQADSVVQRVEGVTRPRHVAILVNRGCASSCEDLILAARQSPSVTIMGTENTAGAEGYGNIRMFYLPGYFRVHMATTRDHSSDGPSYAFDGIPPGVRIPKAGRDPIVFALRRIHRDK